MLGGGLLAASGYFATRPAVGASRFGWAVVAGLAYPLLGLAAAIRSEESGGLRAAVLLLVTVVLAGLLGALCQGRTASRLGAVGRFAAWLSLIGSPPTVGFHAKLALYFALLHCGWDGITVLALAVSAVTLLPALWELRAPASAGSLRGAAAVAVVALLALLILLGLHPYWGLAAGPAGAALD
jgi:NADH:ubiquinone oxidoreductase subunit 2 (subunit N)